MVAVEFESIYAVSHPGRAQLHGFGIFGGSNGYWQAALLRQVRLRGSMLTEDIDSTLRVRQKFGTTFLLCWREIHPWVSLQMLPLIAYVLLHRTGEHANFFVPLLLLSTLITFLVGPVQTATAYLLAVPEIRAHRRWFI